MRDVRRKIEVFAGHYPLYAPLRPGRRLFSELAERKPINPAHARQQQQSHETVGSGGSQRELDRRRTQFDKYLKILYSITSRS